MVGCLGFVIYLEEGMRAMDGERSMMGSSFLPTLVPSVTSSMILPSNRLLPPPPPSPSFVFLLSPETADDVRFRKGHFGVVLTGR